MDFRNFGIIDTALIDTIQDMIINMDSLDKPQNNPSRAYIRDAKAMAATPADVVERPSSYVFVIDMPGIAASDIKVQLEEGNALVVSGGRKRREKEAGVKYLRMERRSGKFMRMFSLPENADVSKISAVSRDGVLSVTVEKLPPPEPKKPKTIEVKVGS